MVVASRQSWNSSAGGPGLALRSAQASAIIMQAGPQVNSVVWWT